MISGSCFSSDTVQYLYWRKCRRLSIKFPKCLFDCWLLPPYPAFHSCSLSWVAFKGNFQSLQNCCSLKLAFFTTVLMNLQFLLLSVLHPGSTQHCFWRVYCSKWAEKCRYIQRHPVLGWRDADHWLYEKLKPCQQQFLQWVPVLT